MHNARDRRSDGREGTARRWTPWIPVIAFLLSGCISINSTTATSEPAAAPAATATPEAAPADAPEADKMPVVPPPAGVDPGLHDLLASGGRLYPEGAPRLLVLVVFDQMRADYLTRFHDQFGPDGFRRLMRDGTWARDCRYVHAVTETAVGHSTLMTGTCPANSGIIANYWIERATGKGHSSVDDPDCKLVNNQGLVEKGSGASPRWLMAETLGDVLRQSTNGRARVVSLSHKDRAAILMAGRAANLVLWFNQNDAQFVTSSFYAEQLPAWVRLFNDPHNLGAIADRDWERLRPEWAYALSTDDDVPFESDTYGRAFPHKMIPGSDGKGPSLADRVYSTPAGNEVLLALAENAIASERLGADDVPDLLCVSFSANDIVGHNYGPYSQEVQDMTLRSDLIMARILEILDQRVGKGEYAIAVTADHGVAPIPEHSQKMKIDGGRINSRELQKEAEAFLKEKFRQDGGDGASAKSWILSFSTPWLWLDNEAIEAEHQYPAEVRRALADWLLTRPGIAAAYTADSIAAGQYRPTDAIAGAFAHEYVPGRSGDVAFAAKPLWLFSSGYSGASHGNPYVYDQQVPLLLFGKGIAPARVIDERVNPEDIAPTFASLVGLAPPASACGRILPGVLVNPGAKP